MKKVVVILKIFNSMDMIELYELQEKTDDLLKKKRTGKTIGYGVLVNLKSGETEYNSIDIELKNIKYLDELIAIIKDLKLKSKYSLEYNEKEIKFN